eukprot:2245337-Amphidinium_carterae.1
MINRQMLKKLLKCNYNRTRNQRPTILAKYFVNSWVEWFALPESVFQTGSWDSLTSDCAGSLAARLTAIGYPGNAMQVATALSRSTGEPITVPSPHAALASLQKQLVHKHVKGTGNSGLSC